MPDDVNLTIEYPCTGETYSKPEYGVYAYGTYPESSVLAGQERRSFINSFPSLAAAQAAYPTAEWVDGTAWHPIVIPENPPDWFDPEIAGESWDGE
jgi:hypothetical protein